MITDRRKFTPSWPSTGCLSILPLESIQNYSFLWNVRAVQEMYFPHFRQRPMSDTVKHVRRYSCLASDMQDKHTELETEKT